MKDGNISRYVTTSLLQKVTNSLSSRKPLCHRHGTQAESTRVIPWQNLTFTLFNSSWVVGEESRIMHTSSVRWDLHQSGQLAYCSVKDRLRQWCAYVLCMDLLMGWREVAFVSYSIIQPWSLQPNSDSRRTKQLQMHTRIQIYIHTSIYIYTLPHMHASFNTVMNLFPADGPVQSE